MSTHCILTEPSLQMHPRKGREGKGSGSGREEWLSSSSMTSGRGLPTTAAGTARVVPASVMDGPYGSER